MERMSDESSTKKLYSNKPEGLRLAGRPRKRWLDEVEQDLKQIGVRGWRRRAQNRDEWRSTLKQVLHGPQRQGVTENRFVVLDFIHANRQKIPPLYLHSLYVFYFMKRMHKNV
jgi:hypothetical protein